MKNHEMFSFVRGFEKFANLEGFQFVLLLNKNKRLFEGEIKDMQDTRENNPPFEEYKKKAQELLVKYADKDENGEPIIVPAQGVPGQGNYQINEHKDVFTVTHKALIKEYKDAIDKQTTLDEDFNEGLNKHIFIKPYMIKETLIPKDINNEQLNILFPLIQLKDEVKEPAKKEPAKKKAVKK